MGVHGGAGESTLAQLFPSGHAAEHAWPVADSGHDHHAVVVVARSHYHGLMRARQAATEWARGQVGVRLVGLALVADAPGRLPKPLRDLTALVAGAVPRVWHVPWVAAWRMAPPDLQAAPRGLERMASEAASLATSS